MKLKFIDGYPWAVIMLRAVNGELTVACYGIYTSENAALKDCILAIERNYNLPKPYAFTVIRNQNEL